MDIDKLYKQKNYSKILDEFLPKVLSRSYKRDNSKINERINELLDTLYSGFFCGAYKEVLELLSVISKIDFIIWNGYQADFLQFEFVSLLYFLFNPNEFDGDVATIEPRIDAIIPSMKEAYIRVGVELGSDVISRIKVYNDFKKGLFPFYTVDYLYPYAPPFGEGTLDLMGCGPFVSLTIRKVPRENDVFTSFSFKVIGYTNGDFLWQGHSWQQKERLPVVRKTMPILNLILLRALCAAPGRFVPLYNIEQVSSANVSVFANDGTPVHVTILGTRFDTQWVGGNAPDISLTEQGFSLLSEDIKRHYGCNHFFIQFQQAKNTMNAGLYVESFLLFCTCAESMLYYWCGEIATLAGKREEYVKFSKERHSICDRCDLFIKSGKSKKMDDGQYANANGHISFLKQECGVSKSNAEKLKSLFYVARDSNLRNDIVHGKVNEVSLETLRKSEDAIMKMQDVFLDIEKKLCRN